MKFKRVTLAGSLRFYDEMLKIAEQMTSDRWLVSMPFKANGLPEEICAEMWKENMLVSDLVYVVNPNGYIGDNTRSDIQMTMDANKPIKYLESPCYKPGWTIYNRASFHISNPFEEVCITELFANDAYQILNKCVSKGIPLNNIFDIRIYRDTILLAEGVHYSQLTCNISKDTILTDKQNPNQTDTSKLAIKFKDQSVQSTYKIVVYVNTKELQNNLIWR